MDHVHGCTYRGLSGSLGGARLKEIKVATLYRELHVLHVAVMLFECITGFAELIVGLGEPCSHGVDRLRSPDSRYDVLSLRVDQELSKQLRLTGRRVSREDDTRGGVLAHVSVHHGHDVHRGA